jgi:hypothetical protein
VVLSLPFRGRLPLLQNISLLTALIQAAGCFLGLTFRASIYPTGELMRAFVPNDIVVLAIGLPVLLGSIWLASRGKLLGLLAWGGALFFITYNSITYVLALPLNRVRLLHLTLLVFSVYSLAALVAGIDKEQVRQRLEGAIPSRLAGGALAGLGILFFVRVLAVLGAAVATGEPVPSTELAVHAADFLITPAWIIGGVLLWRRRTFGFVSGLGLLLQGSMLFIALIGFLLLQPALTGAPFAAADVIVIAIMGLVCFVPFAMFVRAAARL